jgi:hypothetical protein
MKLFQESQLDQSQLYFCGLVGVFNFGNILFYLKASGFAENPNSFACDEYGCNYHGVVGIVVFKEKVSRYNYFDYC